ncbi:MAG: DUF502 domain-containing protein [Rhodanobacteraceae bacterium]|nr:DUF502 domain-containing protein [Rhodanobacteraceae bacterium]
MRSLHIQRYLFAGLLTIIPIWLTWIVFKWIFALLSDVNLPWITALVNAYPDTLGHLRQDWLLSMLAFVSTLVLLYVIGFAASRVLGQRVLALFERLIEHIPIAHSIYGGAKKLMAMLQSKPGGTQRVVLVAFPSPELRTIGFVTRVFRDAAGVEHAAVYIPTTPNPTGGYLEIVPVAQLTATDWSVDQALAFVLSVGATSPDPLPFPISGNPP